MQIKEAKIFNFGKLQNQTCQFAPGINVICGRNESGKSTLHAFLMGMLFGVEKSRGRASEDDMYTKYEPWHAPSYYSGALRFEVDKKPFYLERNFYVKEKSELLRNEADGEELSVAYGDLNILLGGIGKETFGNTYDIPQTGAVTGQAMTTLLTEYLQDAASGGAGIQVHKAITGLQARKKELNADLRKVREEKEVALQRKQLELTLLEQDCAELRKNLQPYLALQLEEKMQTVTAEKQTTLHATGSPKVQSYTDGDKQMPEAGENLHKCSTYKKSDVFWILGNIFLTMVLILLKIVKNIPLNGIVFGAIVLIIANISRIVVKKYQKRYGAEQTSRLARDNIEAANETHYESEDFMAQEAIRRKEEEIQTAREMCQKLQETLGEKEIRLFQLKEELEQAKMPETRERELEENIAALELAAKELERLAKEYYEEVEDELNAEISRYVSLLTNGAYDSVRLGDKGTIRIMTEGRDVTPKNLSSGTLEQIYLALRLAVGAIVTKEETMPIFFDDAFAMYDDERLMQTLQVLAGLDRQILIFSCQTREYQILEQMGIPYHRIQL